MTRRTKIIATAVLSIILVGLTGCSTGPSREDVYAAFYAALVMAAPDDQPLSESTADRAAENLTKLAVDLDSCGDVLMENKFAENPTLLEVWDSVCDELGLSGE